MSWGHKIAVFYLLFVTGMIFMVLSATREKVDLVTEDYYEQELVYQKRILATENASTLSSPVRIEKILGTLKIQLPEEMKGKRVDAEILLYCPADKKKDIFRKSGTQNGMLEIQTPEKISGSYIVKLKWTSSGKEYFIEQNILF